MTRKTDPLTPITPGLVRMYVCGVTVYDRAHIGHAMSAMVFDVLRRYLEFRGLQVMHVVNFTDVDDNIINRANNTSARNISNINNNSGSCSKQNTDTNNQYRDM
jgi:cysteinyl-tRNA synthetase